MVQADCPEIRIARQSFLQAPFQLSDPLRVEGDGRR
jgi:hypothetical protein